jgi:hypothetical protein
VYSRQRAAINRGKVHQFFEELRERSTDEDLSAGELSLRIPTDASDEEDRFACMFVEAATEFGFTKIDAVEENSVLYVRISDFGGKRG